MAAAREKGLEDLFVETLKDIFHAEKQLLRALTKMAKAAKSPELKDAFENHREETDGHVHRLEQIFDLLQKPARTKPCEAMRGLVEEGTEIIDDFKGTDALDAGLLATAQSVEHYEISRYGALKSWAEQLGIKEAARLLNETLDEEKKADKLLTEIALRQVNKKAA